MAITLMTTTGTQADINAALGIAPETPSSGEANEPMTMSVETLTPAKAEPTPELPFEPPAEVAAAPAEAEPVATTDETVPDSEFDEDGEPTTERAARSSHTKLQTIKKLRVRARQAEERAARLEGENAVLRTLRPAESDTQAQPAAPPQAPLAFRPKPTPEDLHPTTGELLFSTNEEFIEALVDWKTEARDAQRQVAEATRHAVERRDAFVKDHPDFMEVIADPSILINDAQKQVLNDPDNADAPAMVYALAKDRALCESIRQMPYHRALMAMGQLQARLATTTAPPSVPVTPQVPVPSAPPPPKTLRGATTPSTADYDTLAKAGDIQGFFAKRNADEQRRRQMR